MNFDNRKYSALDEQKVKDADIRLFIPGCKLNKASQDGIVCPFCGKKKFGVNRKKGANFARCFVCEKGFSNPIQAVMHYENLEYLPALERAAQIAGIVITPQERRREQAIETAAKANRTSFCHQQLEGSGLSEADVMAKVYVNGEECWRSPFCRGRIVEGFNVDEHGDDMLIYYYDLEGRPMQWTPKGASRSRDYVRVRWANPALHCSADGKEMKYQTPAGASTRVYIPEKVRRLYKEGVHIETLFLQEGEKKAEKACKHGMISLGIQGINNFGSQSEGLLQDIQDVAKRCTISNIVLVMDSDWNDLHREIVIGDRADKRPNAFSKAVIKFRQYMKTFHTMGLSVDIWWGHVNSNDLGDKGVDDLLCNSLKGREIELMEDVEKTLNSHNGKGSWIDIHKITAISDDKIRDFWLLNDVQGFFDLHKDRLNAVDTFKIGNIRYKIEEGNIKAMSRYSSAADIYRLTTTSKGETRVEFDDVEAYRYLSAEGFKRLKSGEEASGFEFIRIDDGIIDRIAPYEVRDFVREYIRKNVKNDLVLQFFAKKLSSVMADKQLENLEIVADDFNRFEPGRQRTYYNNGQVEITSRDITPGKPIELIWRNRIIPRRFVRKPIIEFIEKNGDDFTVSFTEDGANCDMVRYLIYTSNNYYKAGQEREVTASEQLEWNQNVVNKITSIGYLLCDFKYATERRAVVVMDHTMSEVGQSHGGAGKSILGKAIGKIARQTFINGKTVDLSDQFLLSEVNRTTRNIYFDDVRVNFDFERIFPLVTESMSVNPKGKDRYTIDASESPKILISTNHAINKAEEDSVARRIAYVELSAWYNKNHMPIDDFNHMLFDDWNEEQWILFDNFMAECVMYYLRSLEEGWSRKGYGMVPPPLKNVELRTLRQTMGEVFLSWAEEFYDPTGVNLNVKKTKKELYDQFVQYAGSQYGHGVSMSGFRKKLESFCKFMGYDLNPNEKNEDGLLLSEWKKSNPGKSFIGMPKKSNSNEWFIVYSSEKEKQPF